MVKVLQLFTVQHIVPFLYQTIKSKFDAKFYTQGPK